MQESRLHPLKKAELPRACHRAWRNADEKGARRREFASGGARALLQRAQGEPHARKMGGSARTRARARARARTHSPPFSVPAMSITRPTRLARSTPSPSKSAAKLFSRRATSSACGGSGEVLTTGRVHGL